MSHIDRTVSVSRQRMQRKAFHDAVDNSALRGGIGLKAFFDTAEKSQQLRDHHKYGRPVIVAELSKTAALDNFVGETQERTRDILADDHRASS